MRAFEHSKSSVPDVAKQSRLLESLMAQGKLQVFLDFHIESLRFRLKSKYGWHVRVRLSLIAYVLTHPILTFLAFLRVTSVGLSIFRTFLPVLREVWADLAEGFWVDFLKRKKIGALVGVMLNGPELSAARNLGIPTFEVQHGVLSETTLIDYFPESAPDYFCSWPLESRHVLRPDGLRWVQIPFSWSHNRQRPALGHRPKALVILTHSDKRAFDPIGLLDANIVEPVKLLMSHGVGIVFRFHPKTSKSQISTFRDWSASFGFDVRFETFRESDIADSILRSHFVITGRSTVWLDALSLGRDCFITDIATYKFASGQFPEAAGELLHQELSAKFLEGVDCRESVTPVTDAAFANSDFSSFFELLSEPKL